jgi:GT2 family glycosyltransferase
MRKAAVTIVTVNYKTAELVNDCVQSIKDYTPSDMPVTIVVIDNGSNDGSLEKITAAHPDITLIDGKDNLGFSKGNNIALREVKTPYAMLFNNDALMLPGTLERMVDFMEANPDCGMCGARVLNPDMTDQDYPCHFPSITEMFRRVFSGPQFPAKDVDRNKPIAMARIHGACLMTRREVLETVGVMDEQFYMYEEDMDWCLRVRNAGWKLWLLPDVSIVHLGGQTTGRPPSGRRDEKTIRPFNPRMAYELRKSRYILYRKHRGFFHLLALKILTDGALLVGSAMALLSSHKKDISGENARKKLKAYLSIMAINPFRMKVDA